MQQLLVEIEKKKSKIKFAAFLMKTSLSSKSHQYVWDVIFSVMYKYERLYKTSHTSGRFCEHVLAMLQLTCIQNDTVFWILVNQRTNRPPIWIDFFIESFTMTLKIIEITSRATGGLCPPVLSLALKLPFSVIFLLRIWNKIHCDQHWGHLW